jgi:hypothetical protein
LISLVRKGDDPGAGARAEAQFHHLAGGAQRVADEAGAGMTTLS